jgi:hypothetical protein
MMLDQDQAGFWKDVLAAGGTAHYDAVSFHAYVYYPLNEYQVIQDKVNYLRGLGETAPLWLSETSMLCYEEYIACGPQFELAQADYYRYLSQNYAKIGLDQFFWFTLTDNEWRHSDLVNGERPKPAWYEYWKASSILRRAANGGS